jgi:hypothetical protein
MPYTKTNSYFRVSEEVHETYLNFKWCIENDFKVFVRTLNGITNECKIVIQRGGISTDGLEFKMVNGRLRKSTLIESSTTYKTQKEAQAALPSIYKMLREKYGKK